MAQRESPDLWSVRDLLVELAVRPAVPVRATPPRDADEPRRVYDAQGLSYESADARLAEEAQVLLAMPVTELAVSGCPGPCIALRLRARTSWR